MTATRARIEKSDLAFRSIGEAADALGIEAHVIRYWETKFPRDVRPVKRADGRRMFRPEDMEALRAIQRLVHQNGLTLKGAKALLADQGVDAVMSGAAILSPARALQTQLAAEFVGDARTGAAIETDPDQRDRLTAMLVNLADIKRRLDAARLPRAA
jgi:DNA-binding transcriptional MerR regulator